MLGEAICNLLEGYITLAERGGNDKFVEYAKDMQRIIAQDDTFSRLSEDEAELPLGFTLTTARLYDLSRFVQRII